MLSRGFIVLQIAGLCDMIDLGDDGVAISWHAEAREGAASCDVPPMGYHQGPHAPLYTVGILPSS